MGWVVGHVVIWIVHLFLMVTNRINIECEGNQYLCGTPLAKNIEWFEDRPDFFLFTIAELFVDASTKIGYLVAMDYALLRHGDGLAGAVGDFIYAVGIIGFFAILISFVYQRLTR